MEEVVTAAEANRSFSRLLKGVQAGRRYVVTSHGKPVAELIPITSEGGRAAAKKALLERLARQPSVQIPRWTRDELYEDEA